MRSPTIEYLTFFAEAAVAMDEGDEEACLVHLRRGLAAAVHRFYDYPWWSEVMAQLYARALAHGIEPQYVSTVIKKRNLVAPTDERFREHWPWPIKIRTLGGFEILEDGRPLRFTGKSPRKPLELLKALIAFGSTGVNQTLLIDALWPELEGDKAQAAFETALYRLRKLLGDETALSMKSGRLSLNTDRVWVDCVSIEGLLTKIRATATHPTERGLALLETYPALLRSAASGPFLPGECASWAISRRESLCSALHSALHQLARGFEVREAWQEAAHCKRLATTLQASTRAPSG